MERKLPAGTAAFCVMRIAATTLGVLGSGIPIQRAVIALLNGFPFPIPRELA